MKNEFIEVVKRWIAGEEVSQTELEDNAEDAEAARLAADAYFAEYCAADAAYADALAAAYAAWLAARAANVAYITRWAEDEAAAYVAYVAAAYVEAEQLVKRYEELINDK